MIHQRRFSKFTVYCRDGLDHLLRKPVWRLVCSIGYTGSLMLTEACRIRGINLRLLKNNVKFRNEKEMHILNSTPIQNASTLKLPLALIREGNGMNLLL